MSKYKLQTDDAEIVFRTLTAEESDKYYHTLKSNDNPHLEEMLFRSISENEELDVESLPAGIIPTVLFCAFKKSGYLKEEIDIPNTIDKYREKLSKSVFFTLYSTIISAQPYTLDALRKKSINELFELFALSEMVLGRQVANTEEMRKTILESQNVHLKPTTGVESVTKEEISLVQDMLKREEFNPEILF